MNVKFKMKKQLHLKLSDLSVSVIFITVAARKCLLPVFSCCHGESQYWSSIDDGFLLVVRQELNSELTCLT